MSEDLLSRYFVDLRSRSDDVRQHAATDLRSTIDRLMREIPADSFARLVNDLNRRIFEFVNSGDVNEKLGGVWLIRELLRVDYEDREARLIRFANYLRMIFQQSGMNDSEQKLIREASIALGELAESGGVLAADTVEFEVKRSLEWLEGDRSEQRRFCAICVLNQLALRTPTLFNVHVGQFLDRVWLTLRDRQLIIRETSAEALRACLLLIAKRSMKLRQTRYALVYQEIFICMRNSNSPESIHAGLLALNELLLNGGKYLSQRYRESCDLVMRWRDHKEKYIRDTVIRIIPALANYQTQVFIKFYSKESLAYLIQSLRNNTASREISFLSLGELSLSIKDCIAPELDAILALIKEGLTARSKKAFCVEALTCVANVCASLGNKYGKLAASMHDIIEQMFSAGLSATLIQALQVICQSMPQHLSSVQERILTGLTVILASGHSASHTGSKDKHSESNRRTLSLSSFASFGSNFSFPLFSPSSNDSKSVDSASTELLYLALKTLGTFDFKNHNLLVFVRDAVLPFLDDDRPRIRTRAAISAAAIVLQTEQRLSGSTGEDTVSDDAGSGIRRFHSMDSLDSHTHASAQPDSTPHFTYQTRPRDHGSLSEVRDRHIVTKIVSTIEQRTSTNAFQRVPSTPSLMPPAAELKRGLSGSPQHPSKSLSSSPLSQSLANDNLYSSPVNYSLIVEIMDRLLTVAVSDPDPSIRKTVIDSLNSDSRFDRWLCDSELIHSLFISLHDEIFVIRESVMKLIGRLSFQLPSLVIPPLRKTITQLLSELEFTGDLRQKEESALLLNGLIQSSKYLMKPYVSPILTALTARLRSTDIHTSTVASACLATLGSLAEIGGELFDSSVYYELIPLIVSIIENKSSMVRKEVALKCLSSLIASTGLVVEPYEKFPHLLPTLLTLLKAGVSWPVRREILKLIGVLGAIEPMKYKEILFSAGIESRGEEEFVHRKQLVKPDTDKVNGNEKGNGNNVNGANVDEFHPSSVPVTVHLSHSHEDYFPTVSLTALMAILREPALSAHHGKAVQALTIVIKSQSLSKLLTFLPIIVPNLITVIKSRLDDGIVDSLFAQLNLIITLVKQNIRTFLPSLISLSLDYLTSTHLNVKLDVTFVLIERLSVVMREEWKIHLPPLLPAMLALVHSDKTANRQTTLRVLHAFETFGSTIVDYLHLVIPAIVRITELTENPFTVRVCALRTIGSLARTMNVSDFAGRIVHPIARILDHSVDSGSGGGKVAQTPKSAAAVNNSSQSATTSITANNRDDLLSCLCLLVYHLNASYVSFTPMINKILHKQNIHCTVYETLVAKIMAHQPVTLNDLNPIKPSLNRINATALLNGKGGNNESDSGTNSLASTGGNGVSGNNTTGGSSANGTNTNNTTNGIVDDDPSLELSLTDAASPQPNDPRTTATNKRFTVSCSALKKAWEVSQRSTGDDWQDWFRGYSIELLKESPAPSLHACAILAAKHHLLARDLFHASFLSCWSELSDEYQDDCVRCLEIALNSVSIPPELVQLLLNLAEFMERDGRPLPIDLAKLGLMAENVHAYAKALHWKEQEFLTSPQSALDGLIGLHNELDEPEAAMGALQLAKSHSLTIQVKESWLEKLQRWDEALEAYELKALNLSLNDGTTALPQSPSSLTDTNTPMSYEFEILMGRMRCLRALGEWDRLDCLSSSAMLTMDDVSQRREVAPMAAQAAWMQGKWREMQHYLLGMEENRFDTEFFRAILAIHSSQYSHAEQALERGREILDAELAALVGESYDRAYRVLVQCQQLTELEEVMKIQQSKESIRERIFAMWRKRLNGCSLNVDVWSSIMSVRSLIQLPEDDIETQIKFSSLCRKSNRMAAALKGFARLMPEQNVSQSFLTLSSDSASINSTLSMRFPSVTFAYLKHLWHAGLRELAHLKMFQFLSSVNRLEREEQSIAVSQWTNNNDGVATLTQSLIFNGKNYTMTNAVATNIMSRQQSNASQSSLTSSTTNAMSNSGNALNVLRSRAYLKLGEWQLALDGDSLSEENIVSALSSFHHATLCSPHSYKAWHQFAVLNFRCVTHFQIIKQKLIEQERLRKPAVDAHSRNDTDDESANDSRVSESEPLLEKEYTAQIGYLDQRIHSHVIPAIKGFFRSIALSGSRGLQDILRLLTLWFGHGTTSEVEAALTEGFNSISIDTWLPVIPQIIARIDSSQASIRRMIQSLLCQIGRAHPQALVYPLAVVLKSSSYALNQRESAASVVMADMRNHSLSLVDEALLVSKELIRVAILWHELWHEALEEASRLWFGSHNVDGMIATLDPFHTLIERGPATLREVGFLHAYGRDLAEAKEWTLRYRRTAFESDLSAAWDLYCTVFRKIDKQMSSMNELELQYVSPLLLNARNLQLAMPGTYLADRDASDKRHVTIAHFSRTLRVIESKQRPRKLSIIGSDGLEYDFLLKGHEDLRQDKRVMQLFGLINGFLAHTNKHYSDSVASNSTNTSKDLSIKGYSVIPLSQESGLIQWLHACDTMHALIKDYRDTNKVLLNIEHRLMIGQLTKAEDFPLLTLLQKVEVFEAALAKTSGNDLARVLWLHSDNSERWLERRGNFTRSLAVMSMVGYVLGLGDRHPCNLMLSQSSGKVIHVDFGDCFEVAQNREKFPERIPFRLTRMLIMAMEISGIEGTYRTVCESVMRVLRENKESVMAVLEAFVHDPLLGWRLLTTDTVANTNTTNATADNGRDGDNGDGITDNINDTNELTDANDTDTLIDTNTGNGSMLPHIIAQSHEDHSSDRPHPRFAPIPFLFSHHDGREHANHSVTEELNSKALSVMARVESKLVGRDFDASQPLTAREQVQRLIGEATSHVNLCQCYVGWCPFW